MKSYLKEHPWKIIETSLKEENNLVSESIASLGNGRLGGRGNFEEKFNGPTLQGSYIAGIYYPDKTKVGWWKNGYPEYFAKVLNSVNWIGLDVWIDDYDFEINPEKIKKYKAELDMKHGLLHRNMTASIPQGRKVKIEAERFYSMVDKDRCFLKYSVTPVDFSGEISLRPYLDFNVRNQDSNYGDSFWTQEEQINDDDCAYVFASTKKTKFGVLAAMKNKCFLNGVEISGSSVRSKGNAYVKENFKILVEEGDTLTIEKYVSISSTFYHKKNDLLKAAKLNIKDAYEEGYSSALLKHKKAWLNKWKESDIIIDGDVKAQQAIRFNIFHMHQTYTGDDARLNIGPKGFTGEKYGGSTFWDTEAYCLPFYLSNADASVSRNLLSYRYKHLEKAIENASKLGFTNGAALYPMVTMNGEECHNEWEITFEEIHRNGAIAFAIKDYIRYTGDESYLIDGGVEVLIAISRFWAQRVNWSEDKQKYVMLGVTGPNEYENNVNNNWYTNYIASWCMKYAIECIDNISEKFPSDYAQLMQITGLVNSEVSKWENIIAKMYFPFDTNRNVFLQADGFLDKELLPASSISDDEYPIHEHWSWDRILRSCFIKQADVLQGLYLFEDDFDRATIKRNFDFYEPMTVHESSLSPCVHSILACKIGNVDKAYELYLRTARLDLDDYNEDTDDGLHITSMAGTWMSITKGFGGMRVKEGKLHFNPVLPKNWTSYTFKLKFRNRVLQISVQKSKSKVELISGDSLSIVLNGEVVTI